MAESIPSIYIIAEAGVNHNGSMDMAVKMIEAAADAGADAVKFQTFSADRLVTRTAVKAEYQRETTGAAETQFAMLKRLELSNHDHLVLLNACREKEIEFLSSPFDMDAIDQLQNLGMQRWKIPSGEITNLPYLRKIASLNQQIILSSGMATLDDIAAALDVFFSSGLKPDLVTVLHCNTEYPTPMADVNLRAMETIRHAFPVIGVGYSDHTRGIEIPVAAAALGACMIEKHFTLDNNLPGPDHKASLSSREFGRMVRAIRNIQVAMGDGVKRPSLSETKNIEVVRKSIVAACPIQTGETFTSKNLAVKRPGTGISPMKWDDLIGKKASRDYKKDDLIHA